MCADNNFSTHGLNLLITNIKRVCRAKGKETLDGIPVNEWSWIMSGRVGNEPMIRLLYCVMRTMIAEDIGLSEVMSIDPEYYVHCLQQRDMILYYERYGNNNN